jgi:hypothetical protein
VACSPQCATRRDPRPRRIAAAGSATARARSAIWGRVALGARQLPDALAWYCVPAIAARRRQLAWNARAARRQWRTVRWRSTTCRQGRHRPGPTGTAARYGAGRRGRARAYFLRIAAAPEFTRAARQRSSAKPALRRAGAIRRARRSSRRLARSQPRPRSS